MKNNKLLTVLMILIIAMLGYSITMQPKAPEQAAVAPPKTAFDRVTETRTLRCAYASLPPFLVVNANSGAVEGPYRLIMENIAKRLGLKLEWAEEVGYGEIPAGFQAGRYDAFCGSLWATTIRASSMTFTDEVYGVPVFLGVGANSTKFDNDPWLMNSADHSFAVYDNDISSQLAGILFPQARQLAVSPMAPISEWMEQVASGKADAIATCDKIFCADYIANNPGKIKIIDSKGPLTKIRVVFGVPLGDYNLKAMFDQALYEMVADGSLNRILQEGVGDKYQYLVPRKVN